MIKSNIISQKIKREIICTIPLFNYWVLWRILKRLIGRDLCASMYNAAWFTVVMGWKCPSSDEWIKKMWFRYTMEIYSDN